MFTSGHNWKVSLIPYSYFQRERIHAIQYFGFRLCWWNRILKYRWIVLRIDLECNGYLLAKFWEETSAGLGYRYFKITGNWFTGYFLNATPAVLWMKSFPEGDSMFWAKLFDHNIIGATASKFFGWIVNNFKDLIHCPATWL